MPLINVTNLTFAYEGSYDDFFGKDMADFSGGQKEKSLTHSPEKCILTIVFAIICYQHL